MDDSSRRCPFCGSELVFRLGELECSGCGRVAPREQPADDSPGAARAGGPQGGAQQAPPPSRATIPPVRVDPQYGYGRPPELYDPAPTLGTEKLLLFGVFVVKALVNIFAAGAAPPDANSTQFLSPVADQIFVEVFNLGFIALIFYLKIIPLKWCCATYSCFVAFMGIAGLLLAAVLTPIIGLLIPENSAFPALVAWLIGAFNVCVQLWIASVLYRDIQKLQAGTG